MRTMHLFAGVGGGLLADLILGHDPVCTVEWDAYCCSVLRERRDQGWFPGLHVHEGDIRLFDPSPWEGRVDCIHAGFPCQDISCAGGGKGIDGERSGLFSEVIMAALIVRPQYLFLENSPQIITRGLIHVLRAIAAIGYECWWTILAAADVGAPHLRKRWWCLCRHSDANSFRESQPEGRESVERGWSGDMGEEMANAASDRREPRRKSNASEIQEWRESDRSSVGVDVCNANCEGLEKREGQQKDHGEEQPPFVGAGWWDVEPGVGRISHGVASRVHRLRGLGNGQVPLQAAVAWKIIWEEMRKENEK